MGIDEAKLLEILMKLWIHDTILVNPRSVLHRAQNRKLAEPLQAISLRVSCYDWLDTG